MTDPERPADPQDDPRSEPIYRAILAVLVASTLVGAVVTLTGETHRTDLAGAITPPDLVVEDLVELMGYLR